MNYTGFGTDPNYIYSFRHPFGRPPEAMVIGINRFDPFSALRKDISYRQSDPKGRRRMEQAVSMGLPPNTDINQVQKITSGGRITYSAPRPQPWGTWGALVPSASVTTAGRPVKPSPLPPQPQPPAPQPPAQESTPPSDVPEGYLKNRYGYLEKDYSKEGYTRNRYGYWQKTGKEKPKNDKEAVRQAQIESTEFGRMIEEQQSRPNYLTGTFNSIRFPYAGY